MEKTLGMKFFQNMGRKRSPHAHQVPKFWLTPQYYASPCPEAIGQLILAISHSTGIHHRPQALFDVEDEAIVTTTLSCGWNFSHQS